MFTCSTRRSTTTATLNCTAIGCKSSGCVLGDEVATGYTGLLCNLGEKSINLYFIMVLLRKSIKVWYSKAQSTQSMVQDVRQVSGIWGLGPAFRRDRFMSLG